MRKKIQKIVAAITLCAFSLGSITPAYANTEKVTRLDFEQISIEYDANGDLSRELFKIENTYYYRVIEEGKNIAVSLNEDGSGDITINNSQDNSFIYYSKLNGEPTTNTRSQVLLADKFAQIVASANSGDIPLTRVELDDMVASTYAIPTGYRDLIAEAIVEDCEEEAECQNKFLASKSTSNVRASLYSTVEYSISNKVNLALGAGLALTTILALINLPSTLLQAALLLVSVGGTLVLKEDTVLDGYNVTVTETKSVKCDGHVDYDAYRTNRGEAAVANNNGKLSAAVELGERNESNVIIYDNDAMLDKGIQNHKNFCL